MSAEISFFHLFLEASILVQFVMLVLLAFSVVCWAMIFQRRKILRTAANELKVFEDNPGAIRAYEKAGFVLEGRLRQSHFQHGIYKDDLIMSVLREDWKRKS